MTQPETGSAESRGGLSRRALLATAGAAGLLSFTAFASAQTAPTPRAPAAATRMLGALEVAPVGLGCQWVPGPTGDSVMDRYGATLGRDAAIALIREALDAGVTLFDTAEAYGPFISEEIVGEALEGSRDRVALVSKFGWNIDPDTGESLGGVNSRPEHVRRAIEGMLRRLRTDRIDLVYQHRVDPEVPIEDVAGVIGEMMDEGKVLGWGLSEPGIGTIRRAHAERPLTAIQNEYSMLWRGPEAEVLPLCEELGIGFVCWSPMGMGFVGGKMDAGTRFGDDPSKDIRVVIPRFAPEALRANMALFHVIEHWAREKEATPAQIGMAWLLAQKPFVVPIPGTTSIAHMRENTAASAITFTETERAEIDAQVAAVRIEGARLPEASLAMTGVEAPPRG